MYALGLLVGVGIVVFILYQSQRFENERKELQDKIVEVWRETPAGKADTKQLEEEAELERQVPGSYWPTKGTRSRAESSSHTRSAVDTDARVPACAGDSSLLVWMRTSETRLG